MSHPQHDVTEAGGRQIYLFRALRHPNYRLFFMGQGGSLIGTWMQSTAMSWLVYRLTDSPLMLGLNAFLLQLPNFLLAPLGGVFADAGNKQRQLVMLQVLMMSQATALAALTLTGAIHVSHLLVLSLLLGVFNSFETPIRQSFVVEMLEDKSDLPNAIALNSSMFNIARLTGPPIAGLIIAAVGRNGEGIVFAINAASFFAVLWALLAMRVKARPRADTKPALLTHLREGFLYSWRTPAIRTLLLLMSVASLTTMSYVTLLPVFARTVLGGSAATHGYLTGAVGLGALLGAVHLASRRGPEALPRMMNRAMFGLGVAVILFALSREFWLSLPILVLVGFSVMTMVASTNTMVQTVVADRMRGRVLSHYTVAFLGMAPFGGLLAGFLAKHIGAPATVIIGGSAMLALAVLALPSIDYLTLRMQKAGRARRSS